MSGLASLFARSIRAAASRRYLLYAPILLGATGLLFCKTFVYARVLPVESFGLLSQALLAANTFANFAGAGLQLLAHKLLPQYYARAEQALADDLLASAVRVFGWATLLGGLLLCLALGTGWLSGAFLWGAALVYAAAQSLFTLRLIDIKSALRFMDHARLSLVRAAALVSVGISVAAIFRNVAATVAVEGLVSLLLAAPIYTGSRGARIVHNALSRDATRSWLAANLPAALSLLWLNGTVTLLYAVDRWSGIALLDRHQYGIFSLGLVILVVFETLQTVVNVAAYPLMGRMIAEGEHARAFRLATLATLIVSGLTVILYVPFVFLLDIIVRAYLPAYLPATGVIKIAVLAGALRLADFYASFAILCNYEQRLAGLFCALTVAAPACIFLAHSVGHVRFDPVRMAMVTLGIAICGFLLNLTVATRARRRATPLVFA